MGLLQTIRVIRCRCRRRHHHYYYYYYYYNNNNNNPSLYAFSCQSFLEYYIEQTPK